MADRSRYPTDAELGDALRALGSRLRYPETPDLASTVRKRIEGHQRAPVGRFEPGRRFMAVAAVLVIMICGAVLAFPAGRSAVAGWLDLPGVTIFKEDPEERPVLGGALLLGEPLTLDEAREQVSFTVLVPQLDSLGEPDEVYLDRQPVGGAVSFIYHADDDIPEASETGVGLLLTQFQGRLNPGMYGKGAPAGVEVDVLTINGQTAYWISGEPHRFTYYDRDGEYSEGRTRLAGNTLLWQAGGLTLRLESALDRDAAMEIADSMR